MAIILALGKRFTKSHPDVLKSEMLPDTPTKVGGLLKSP